MRAALRTAWEARAPRERRVLAIAAAVLGAAAYILVVHSAGQGRAQLGTGVAALREQAVLMDRQAVEIDRLRAKPVTPEPAMDLRTLLQARTDAAGLSGALTRLDVADPEHAQVSFGAVRFADWVAWVAALQAQRVRLDTARVEALSTPGMVSAAATLSRAKAP
jgi:type II secretory pathway component PulM